MSEKSQTVTLREVVSEKDVATARRLFREYAEWLGIDLSFQSFDEELASLPVPYSRPHDAKDFKRYGSAIFGRGGVT